MKFHHYALGILLTGLTTIAKSQDNKATEEATSDTRTISPSSEVAGEGKTFFSTQQSNTIQKGCPLVQNKWKARQIYNYKNGYKIITDDEDEIIKVKHYKNGVSKVKYENGYESMDYKMQKNGEMIYSYSYIDGCKKVLFKRTKNGINSLTNTTELSTEQVRENMNRVMRYGAKSCVNYSYS